MHIINAMFSKGLGGIEQALVDYCEALKLQGHKVTAIIATKAKIKDSLLPLGINIIEVKNFSAWDFLAMAYLKKIMKQLAPDAVITHGSRAAALIVGIDKAKRPPIIGVTHNYKIKRLIGLDAILAITEDLKATVIAAGQPENTIFKISNMVRAKPICAGIQRNKSELVIGTMGRFVKKKGFDVFIRSLADLKAAGIEFKAVLGGGGEEEQCLKNLAAQLQLGETLSFIGWVKDKTEFFENIDIFCLPSLHEPFGIILLEAFAYKKPVVVADSEGPLEIVSNEIDALLVPKGNSKAMADAILRIKNDEKLAENLAKNAFAKAQSYDISHFGACLNDALVKIIGKR